MTTRTWNSCHMTVVGTGSVGKGAQSPTLRLVLCIERVQRLTTAHAAQSRDDQQCARTVHSAIALLALMFSDHDQRRASWSPPVVAAVLQLCCGLKSACCYLPATTCT
jgi:hypothetical protein